MQNVISDTPIENIRSKFNYCNSLFELDQLRYYAVLPVYYLEVIRNNHNKYLPAITNALITITSPIVKN